MIDILPARTASPQVRSQPNRQQTRVFAGGGLAIAMARGSTGATAQAPTTDGDGAAGADESAGTDEALTRRTLQIRTRWKAFIAVLAVGALIGLLLLTQSNPSWAKGYAAIAGILVVVKELLSAFARDRGLAPDKSGLEDSAAICSLFAVVFGVPAVAAAIL
ncbi:hypothetical protein KK090_14925 [Curtobacterium flaccumfaciens pv. poinsettiae]|uniref:hypothetical protein n=1 Tax=Curtobacterium poinsettiae TaxID=159612 RepID=UPI001BE0143D|nr:hypothetical protein [Curtobacterium flaccumfaciens]MBT1620552.1 hypothetical protein [Curtobacterium flaccumfaciens pv. poinsettiae]